jgi:hypothetical protein
MGSLGIIDSLLSGPSCCCNVRICWRSWCNPSNARANGASWKLARNVLRMPMLQWWRVEPLLKMYVMPYARCR